MNDQTKPNDDGKSGEGDLELTPTPSVPKKRKSRPKGGVTIHLDDQTAGRVDAYIDRFRADNPGINPEKREILVNLIHRGLDAVEAVAAYPIAGGIALGHRTDDELREMVAQYGIAGLPDSPTRDDMIAALEVVL